MYIRVDIIIVLITVCIWATASQLKRMEWQYFTDLVLHFRQTNSLHFEHYLMPCPKYGPLSNHYKICWFVKINFLLQYQLGSDPVKYLLEASASLLNETTSTNCGRLAPIFTHNMRLMFQTVWQNQYTYIIFGINMKGTKHFLSWYK